MIVADNGSNWFLSGAPDNRWSNDDLHALGAIPGSDFEVVNTSSAMVNPDSGQARSQSGAPTATAASTASVTASASEMPGTPTLTAQDARKQDQNTRATTNWPLMLAVVALVGVGLIGGGIWLRARRRRILSPFR
jgi:cobalamin biosynthesis Mg chelatase CobN